MTAILGALFLLAIGLLVAIGLGYLLARLEARAESGLRCLPGKPNRRTEQGQGEAIEPGDDKETAGHGGAFVVYKDTRGRRRARSI